jgi:hypothetical protein
MDEMDFRNQCAFVKDEFDALLDEISDDIERPRNVRGQFTPLEQAARESKPSKMTTANRLLMCLTMLKTSMRLSDMVRTFGISKAIVSDDFRHVLDVLHTSLAYEISLPAIGESKEMKHPPGMPEVWGSGWYTFAYSSSFI